MICINVHIAAGPDKVTHLKARLLGDHMGKQRVAGNIKRQAEEGIHRTHSEHAAQLAVRHIELEDKMARRQLHLLDLPHIPRADDMTAGIRVVLNGVNDRGDLVNNAAVRTLPGPPL
ncbi:hypothetical protein D3C73_1209900 [compost metagenome]